MEGSGRRKRTVGILVERKEKVPQLMKFCFIWFPTFPRIHKSAESNWSQYDYKNFWSVGFTAKTAQNN